jgi:carboxylesterase type B
MKGSFGFLYLNNTSNKAAPGSMGLSDQILSIEWYKEKYLGLFGGASSNLTLFGCSSGAMRQEFNLIFNLLFLVLYLQTSKVAGFIKAILK